MKRLAIALLIVASATAASADIHGAWTATADSPDRVHLQMMRGSWNNWGQSFNLSTLGLSPSVITTTTATPINVTLTRDAGTFVLEGTFKLGDGAGHYTFTPNRSYFDQLRSIGVTNDLSEDKPEADQLMSLAIVDVSLAYARTMHGLFRDATLRDIRKARAVDVTPQYITAMREAGMEIADLNDAAKLAAVEVTAEWIRSMRAAGVDVRDAHDARRLRAVDVTPKFIAELADAGYKNLSVRDLIRMASAGVDARFIRDMAKYKDKNKEKQ